jgi:hypothetical protein
MRHPRIKPLAALRPDLPERLCLAVTAALAPEARNRTIRAAELADEVRASIDVERGRIELGELLQLWRGPLERRPAASTPSNTDSSANHKHATMNYEQVAALDDEAPTEGPTVEAHALPVLDAPIPLLARPGEGGNDRTAQPPSAPFAEPARAGWRLRLVSLALVAMVLGGALAWCAHLALEAWGGSSGSERRTE